MMDELVVVARIRKPHGVKGELNAEPLSFDMKRYAKLKTVTLRKDGEVRDQEIESIRIAGQGLLVKFKGIDDRDIAGALRGYEICIPEADRLPLPDSEAYLDEVVGMKVEDADSGQELGVVVEVYLYPSGTAYEIRLTDGTLRSVTTTGNEVVSLSRSKKVVKVRLLEEL